ncbi:MAG: hypothetical protein JWL81_858, partial [Verrucomicrobiales bacterium]|nr:hypothetical protein [Verrucomicrobiales bacterium]
VMKDPADRIRVVEDEAVFERVSQLPGLDEPGNAHVVWKMRRPPAGGNSLGAVPQIR